MVYRGISIFMVLIFLLSVAVQYNDPDPLEWMIIYGICAAFAGFGAIGRHTVLALPAALLYWAGVFYWMPHEGVANPLHLLTDVKMAGAPDVAGVAVPAVLMVRVAVSVVAISLTTRYVPKFIGVVSTILIALLTVRLTSPDTVVWA